MRNRTPRKVRGESEIDNKIYGRRNLREEELILSRNEKRKEETRVSRKVSQGVFRHKDQKSS